MRLNLQEIEIAAVIVNVDVVIEVTKMNCVHCDKQVDYDDAKMCRACYGPLCNEGCKNDKACTEYAKHTNTAGDFG